MVEQGWRGVSVAERKELFDGWAGDYDASLKGALGFPFEGYDAVLAGVVGGGGVGAGASVLDVGTGTGALAARFAALGCHVLGVDLSEAMLAQACRNVPEAQFAPLELLGAWDVLDRRRFGAVVSSYVLHEFDLLKKVKLLTQMVSLLEPGGRVVVGDISFPTLAAHGEAHSRWAGVWDESEHYWVAGEAVATLGRAGFSVHYTQVSFCGGVYVLSLL